MSYDRYILSLLSLLKNIISHILWPSLLARAPIVPTHMYAYILHTLYKQMMNLLSSGQRRASARTNHGSMTLSDIDLNSRFYMSLTMLARKGLPQLMISQ